MSNKFRQMVMTLVLLVAMVSLAACGEEAVNEKELFASVIGEASALESFTLTMSADSQMESDGVNMDNKTESTMDIIVKPEIAFKQITTVEAEGQQQEVESYFTADGFFMKDPSNDSWIKLPQGFKELALQSVDQQSLDPSAQLSELLDYAEQFSLEEKDGVYIFSLTAQGEAFSKLIQEKLDEQESVWGQAIDMELHALEYVVNVDKKSKKLLSMNIVTDMSIMATESSPAMQIKSDITTTYSNHNKIKEIVVPEEALNAEEMDFGLMPELPQ